jgi:hypothetical protein
LPPTPRRCRSPAWRRRCRSEQVHRPAFLQPGGQNAAGGNHQGAKTSDETLARGFDFVLQIKKTPIVVNDSRGFFTSRVFGTFTNEGIAMLGEGVARR